MSGFPGFRLLTTRASGRPPSKKTFDNVGDAALALPRALRTYLKETRLYDVARNEGKMRCATMLAVSVLLSSGCPLH
jgi:hypothetical protein